MNVIACGLGCCSVDIEIMFFDDLDGDFGERCIFPGACAERHVDWEGGAEGDVV